LSMAYRFGFVSALAVTALLAGPGFAQQMRAPPAAHQLETSKNLAVWADL